MCPLESLSPPLKLHVINIAEAEIPEVQKARYLLEVPVLLLEVNDHMKTFELPRVSPRLSGAQLLNWIEKVVSESLKIN